MGLARRSCWRPREDRSERGNVSLSKGMGYSGMGVRQGWPVAAEAFRFCRCPEGSFRNPSWSLTCISTLQGYGLIAEWRETNR